MRKERITLCLDREIIEQIDVFREFVSRSSYMNNILRTFIKIKKDGALNGFDKILQK